MVLEEVGLAPERVGHALVVQLRAVHDADKAELEQEHAPREYVERMRAHIHQVEVGQDADCPPALRIDREGLGVARSTLAAETARTMLCVCEGREEDKRGGGGSGGTEPSAPIRFRDVFKDERADLSLGIA